MLTSQKMFSYKPSNLLTKEYNSMISDLRHFAIEQGLNDADIVEKISEKHPKYGNKKSIEKFLSSIPKKVALDKNNKLFFFYKGLLTLLIFLPFIDLFLFLKDIHLDEVDQIKLGVFVGRALTPPAFAFFLRRQLTILPQKHTFLLITLYCLFVFTRMIKSFTSLGACLLLILTPILYYKLFPRTRTHQINRSK